MKRNDWEFPYTTDLIVEAAKNKIAHHQSRLTFWRDKSAQVMGAVRADGISVKESAAGPNYTNAAYGPQVVVKAEYQRDLNECHGKIEQHTEKIAEYQSFVMALSDNPGQEVALNVDDVVYFFHTPEQQ